MADVSKILGQYMLQGWVLTDDVCPTPKCNTPLMRAPRNRTPESFCANCDGGPIGSSTRKEKPTEANLAASPPSSPHPPTFPSIASSPIASHPSTPPTSISTSRGLADHELDDFVLPPPSEAALARRAQSDFASAEIGKKLLQGWAMLADECPNEGCWGVPLVRAPKRAAAGGAGSSSSTAEVQNRKECVVCKRVYVDAPDGSLREVNQSTAPSTSRSAVSTVAPAVPSSLHPPLPATNAVPTAALQPHHMTCTYPSAQTTAPAPPHPVPTNSAPAPASIVPTDGNFVPVLPTPTTNVQKHPTLLALEQALTVLTAQLASATSPLDGTVDVRKIGEIADAIAKCAGAVESTRRVFG